MMTNEKRTSWGISISVVAVVILTAILNAFPAVYADDMFPGNPIVWLSAFIVYGFIKVVPELALLVGLGFVLRYEQVFIGSIIALILEGVLFSGLGTAYDALPIVLIILLIGSYIGRNNEKWKLENRVSSGITVLLAGIAIWAIGILELAMMWLKWKLWG